MYRNGRGPRWVYLHVSTRWGRGAAGHGHSHEGGGGGGEHHRRVLTRSEADTVSSCLPLHRGDGRRGLYRAPVRPLRAGAAGAVGFRGRRQAVPAAGDIIFPSSAHPLIPQPTGVGTQGRDASSKSPAVRDPRPALPSPTSPPLFLLHRPYPSPSHLATRLCLSWTAAAPAARASPSSSPPAPPAPLLWWWRPAAVRLWRWWRRPTRACVTGVRLRP